MTGSFDAVVVELIERAADAAASKVAAQQLEAMESLVDIKVIAKLLDVTTDHVRNLIDRKQITAYKIGKYWKLRPSEVLAELKINREPNQ